MRKRALAEEAPKIRISGFIFLVRCFGFLVLDSGFRILGVGFGFWDLGFQVPVFGFQISGSRFRVSGFRFQVSGFRFQISGFGFRVSVSGFRVPGFGLQSLGLGSRVSDSGFKFKGYVESRTEATAQSGVPPWSCLGAAVCLREEREFFIDNLLVRIHFIIVMIRWIGLAPMEFKFPFPGSLASTFLVRVESCKHPEIRILVPGFERLASGYRFRVSE